MAEWFNVLFGLLATFSVMCLFCMIMSIVVVLHESKDNVHSSSPSKLFKFTINKEDDNAI